MGWGKSLMKIGRTALKNPLLKGAASFIPGAGLALTAVSMASDMGMFSGGGASKLQGAGGMPAMPPPLAGNRGVFRNDANSSKSVEAVAISKGDLRVTYRRPAGKAYRDYVVVRDNNGDPMAVPKDMARKQFGWRPAKRPPISVGQWSALRKANGVVKTLKRCNKMAMQIANFGHRPRPSMIDVSKPKYIPVKGRRVA